MNPDTMPPAEPRNTQPEATSGKMQKALRWFLAEFLVVVIGVLVALAVSAWWQSQQDRALERRYLEQLDADLLSTESDMHDALTLLTARAVAAAKVQHAFCGERPASDAVLEKNLALPGGTSRYRPVLGNIEALISSGDIGVIRSAPLRTALVSYVEWSKARLEDVGRYDETYYRPAVNELRSAFDIGSFNMDSFRKKNAERPHAFDMRSMAATGSPPFPVNLDELLKNRVIYSAYAKLMLAHRNQAGEYGSILESARFLHAQVYRQLHGTDEPGNCQLTRVTGSKDYAGTCGAMFATGDDEGAKVRLRLHAVDAITSGAWKINETPATMFAGQMLIGDGEANSSDIEVEASLNGDGIVRTLLGWFSVSSISFSDDEARLSFRIDTREPITADAMDVAILQQTKMLLVDASKWDRHDDRQCNPKKPVLSLYCGLIEASRMKSGGVHHRRPALQIVRALVDLRSAGRNYEHRLRDYNNDARTTLPDIQKLLDEAIAIAEKDVSKKDDPGP